MALREVLRRVVLFVGLLAGLWLVTWAPGGLLRVRPIDWRAEQIRSQSRAADAVRTLASASGTKPLRGNELAPEAYGDLQAFVAHETEGREIAVSGPEWEGLFKAVAATALGNPPDPGWAARQGQDYFHDSLYFRLEEAPLRQVAGEFRERGTFRYIRIQGAQRAEYLGVSLGSRDDMVRYAPASLAYPYRHLGLWVLLATVLAYALIPGTGRPREGLCYTGARLSDAAATLLVGSFFAIPMLVTNANAADATPFGEGWIWLTAAMWGLGLLAATIYAAAAWYATKRLDLVGEDAVYQTMSGRLVHRLEDVMRLDVAPPQISPAVGALNRVVSFLDWRAAGADHLRLVPEYYLRVLLRDGRSYGFAPQGLKGIEPFLGRLRERGVEIAPEVYDLLEREPDDPAFTAGFAAPQRDWLAPLSLAVLVAGLGYGLMVTRVPALAPVQPGSLAPQPFALPAESSKITPEVLAPERRILAEMTDLNARLKEITRKAETAGGDDRRALLDEAEKILSRVQELQSEFERLRE